MYGIRHNFYALVLFVAVVPCPSLHLPYAVMEFLSLAVSTDSPNCKLFLPALPAEAVAGIIEKIHIGLFIFLAELLTVHRGSKKIPHN